MMAQYSLTLLRGDLLTTHHATLILEVRKWPKPFPESEPEGVKAMLAVQRPHPLIVTHKLMDI
jgi:hypothetical protein